MMLCFRVFIIAMMAFCIHPVYSQTLFINSNVQSAIKKHTRTTSGKPGIAYWQNRGDYDIQVSFSPSTNLLSGEETIVYYNNSPDTLSRLIFRLLPDLYKQGVTRSSRIDPKDINKGVEIENMKIGDESITSFTNPAKAFHANTNLIILPKDKVMPHTSVRCIVKWHYTVNAGSPVRTGLVDPGSYFIAYFFPRLAVYDDIDGWDDWSYNGTQEFYNDFGNFNVKITVPVNQVVWATGERKFENGNLDNKLLEKLKMAMRSEKIIPLIDSTDYGKQTVFNPENNGTWFFQARDVTDFVFAISDHYLWDASSVITDSATGKRTLTSAVYFKKHTDYFDVANQAHQSVYYMSHYYPKWPFPFPQITVFDGTDQMEYPMMVNDNPTPTHKDAVQLTSHEIFHSYFPFYMGINETQYAWMDEGWATIGESVISPLMGEPEDEGIFSKTRYERTSGTDKDLPLISNTKLYESAAYVSNSYGKAGLCYYVLQDMLGDKLYFKALHQYIDDWHGRHPEPYDFFNSFSSGSGKDLNWFWQKWFFDWVYPDLAIRSVTTKANDLSVIIENKGGLPVPVVLVISMANGEEKQVHYGADTWKDGKKLLTVNLRLKSTVKSIKLGNEFIPDKYKEDNVWPVK